MLFLSLAGRLLKVLPPLLALAGCSSLGVLNAVLPKDSASSLAASDVAFGDDPRQRLDVYVPEKGQAEAKRGVVVFVYGGSWSNGARGDYSFAGRAFAAQGFVTIVADYRLVPDHPYPAFVQDTGAVVAWAHRNAAQYGGDGTRIFLVGHSAGAYNAMMVALAPEFLMDAGISPEVIKGVAGLAGPYEFLPLENAATIAAFGHLPPDDLAATQPLNRPAQNIYAPPAFLATGDEDTTVRLRNVPLLAEALRATGHVAETRIYRGIGHAGLVLALSRPLRGRAPVLEDVADFFRRQ
jgi:acetyl esterase/lipase